MDAADRVIELTRSARPPAGIGTSIVSIDGLGGAGKSTLAAIVSDRIGAGIIHTDDFASWDVPLAWGPRLLEQVLEPLAQNRPARYQRYDWDAREFTEWRTVEPGGVLLIEGVSSSQAAFRPYLAATVWVDTPRSVRLERGLQRDGEDAAAQWAAWMTEEEAWITIERPYERVDLIVAGTSA